jgi:AcrR family transcriptional regulator
MADDEAQQLVGAAWRVLERSGYEGFKVQLVMRDAGVSARAFYRHFPDKDQLLLALLRDEMARAAARLRAAVAEVDDPVAQVEAWIRAVISAAADPRRVARARLFSSQQPLFRRFPWEVAEGTQLLVEPLRQALERGAGSGAFPWVEPDRDAPLIYALTGGEMTAALTDRPGGDVEDVVAATTGFVLRSLGVPPTVA